MLINSFNNRSIEEMQGWKVLKLYFENKSIQTLQLLTDRACLKSLIEENTLVILLRHIENIQEMDIETLLKTLLLMIYLIKINPSKIYYLLPFKKINPSWFKDQKFNDSEKIILQKTIAYANFLIHEVQNKEDIPSQLECLTNNLFQIFHLIEYKIIKIAPYAKIYYWLVQERLYSLWMTISRDLNNLGELESNQFEVFYENYCLFCQYRRKIPKIKHKNLKSVEITSQTNKKIEEIYLEFRSQNVQKREKGVWESRMQNMVNLMNSSDWDDE